MKLSLNVGLTWPEVGHVFSVGYQGWIVGKVWFATDRQTDAAPWEWQLCIPMTLPDDAQGVARSKREALQAVADCLHRVILRTPADRLERAFRLAEVSGLKFESGAEMEFEVDAAPAAEPSEPVQPRAVRVAAQTAVHGTVVRPRPVAPTTGVPLPQVAVVPAERKRMPVIKVRMTPRSQGGVQAPAVAQSVGQPRQPPGIDRS